MNYFKYLLIIPLVASSFAVQAMRRPATTQAKGLGARPGHLIPSHGVLRPSPRIRIDTHPKNQIPHISVDKPLINPIIQEIRISHGQPKQEKRQEYKNHPSSNRQFKKELFDSSQNSKSYWTIGGIAAALAAWELWSTSETEAQEYDGIKELIEAIKFKDASKATKTIEKYLARNSNQATIDIIARELINSGAITAPDILANLYSVYRLQICESIVKHFYLLIEKKEIRLLASIIKIERDILQNPELRNSIIKLIKENIFTLLDQPFGSEVILESIKYEDCNDYIKKFIVDNLQKIGAKEEGLNLIHEILRSSESNEFAKQLLPQAYDLFAKLNPLTVNILLKKSACATPLTTLIKNGTIDSFQDIAKATFLMRTCQEEYPHFSQSQNVSQTLIHLKHNWPIASDNRDFISYVENKELYDVAEALLLKEKELNHAGYYTFVHGQRREYYFLEKLYTMLWEIKTGKKADDYIFPWLVKPVIENHELINESEKRKLLLKQLMPNGRFDQKDTLFLNYALFANLQRQGENSAAYVAHNFNQWPVYLTPEAIFNLFDNKDLYLAFEDEIRDLEKQYKKASNRGNSLLFGVPKDKVHDTIYSALPMGRHRTEHASTKIQELMENILTGKTDTDNPIFCMPMTFDLSLNPHSGIKIFPFITGDPDKLKELKAKEEALFEKIRNKARKEAALKGDSHDIELWKMLDNL